LTLVSNAAFLSLESPLQRATLLQQAADVSGVTAIAEEDDAQLEAFFARRQNTNKTKRLYVVNGVL
jgi:hypothetical protein